MACTIIVWRLIFRAMKNPILLLLCLSICTALGAQSSLFDALHTTKDTVEIGLETDWKGLFKNKKKKIYQPITFTINRPSGAIVLKGKVRTRGHMRLEVCQNPSLKIKLKKKDLLAAGFTELNDMKCVLQCTRGSLGRSYLKRERMVYEMYPIFSDFHHRVIPIRLTPSEGLKGEDPYIEAMFVEDEEQLAQRYNARILETKRASTGGLQREAYVNMCLFNYLILNTDWQVFNLHNVEFINPEGSLKFIPIPYDFDYSGFVGTSYAVPFEALGIQSVQEPKWLGKDISVEEMKRGAQHFISKKEEVTTFISDYPTLSASDRKRLLKRLDAFYEVLEKEKKLLRLLKG